MGRPGGQTRAVVNRWPLPEGPGRATHSPRLGFGPSPALRSCHSFTATRSWPKPNACPIPWLWTSRQQPAPGRWKSPSPIVENRPPNVDDHAPSVDSAIHNMLWLINGTERYMLWFGLDCGPAPAYRSKGRQLDRDAQTASRWHRCPPARDGPQRPPRTRRHDGLAATTPAAMRDGRRTRDRWLEPMAKRLL